MKIRLLGQRNILGGGTHFSNFADALLRIATYEGCVEECNLLENAQIEAAAGASGPGDINIWFRDDERIPLFRGTHIVWAIFEIERLPPSYVDFLRRHAQVVWVPSQWGKDVLVANGIDPALVDVVPEGVSPDAFHPHLRVKLDKAGQPFRFLMLGKYEARKSYEETLDAFTVAFGDSRDVQLVIKADYFVNFEEKQRAFNKMLAARAGPNVNVLWGNVSTQDLFGLYSVCDAFVLPSKGEAWGLPLLEAAASGLPLVATYYSGQTQFLSYLESSLLKVDFALEDIRDPEMHAYWPSADGNLGRWAQPSVDGIARSLRECHGDYVRYATEARRNSVAIRQRFSWSAAADLALCVLSDRGLIPVEHKVLMA